MLRKFSLVAAAALALGAAALAPSAASAHWYGGYGGWHGGYGGWHGGYGGWHRHYGYWGGPRVFAGPVVSYGYGGCYVRHLVPTPWGPRWRLINRCY